MLAISAPSEDPGAELAQGDGALARSDQGSRPHADLDARGQNEFLARLAVLSQPGRTVEISNAPLSALMNQLRVPGRNASISQLYLARGRGPDVPSLDRRAWQHMHAIHAPLMQLNNLVIAGSGCSRGRMD